MGKKCNHIKVISLWYSIHKLYGTLHDIKACCDDIIHTYQIQIQMYLFRHKCLYKYKFYSQGDYH